ncbi:hypothetical protein EYC84_004880 [Monilinia fructicola]|uniref:PARP catalytic domain-containing protein n=1 Tax=Monilinia fructicola TaxID=38448 RepID=A0A5M9K588_MONFR|nr:hypothetical protein EYC84_004880 [Monilinia fructicola]
MDVTQRTYLEPIEVGLLALDVSAYPGGNSFMVFTKSDGAPKVAIEALNQLTPSPNGVLVADLITSISQKLQKALSAGSREAPISLDDEDAGEDDEMEDDAAEEESEDDSGFSDDYDEDFPDEHMTFSNGDAVSNIFSMSIQATKLGLSQEAMQAWDIESDQYVTLLIRYSEGYKPYEAVIDEPAKHTGIDFRIGVGNSYKPSVAAAFSAFSDVNKADAKNFDNDNPTRQEDEQSQSRGFSNIFIKAKECFDERQGRPLEENADLFSNKRHSNTSKDATGQSPQLLTNDHLILNNGGSISFPLLAGQFALMYLVRCTEFCLVCHDKITGEFEALKPYVCDKPLCLYQYMSLGFGPSVEHEIQTQPYVVDLLLNFCYTSAWGNRIREYPTGMSLSVPPAIAPTGHIILPTISSATTNGSIPVTVSQPSSNSLQGKVFDVGYDVQAQEVTFKQGDVLIRRGDWVRILVRSRPGDFMTQAYHSRVEDISSWPVVKLSAPISQSIQTAAYRMPAPVNKPSVDPTPDNICDAQLTIYNCNFDKMSSAEKCGTITMLLDTLPSIKDLREYIDRQSLTEEPNLRKWTEHLNKRFLRLEKNWIQFRFAQGSPDKELRFLNALKAQQTTLDPKYPTMFAFHGSALQNWHSIIRHGLDFKETLNERASLWTRLFTMHKIKAYRFHIVADAT